MAAAPQAVRRLLLRKLAVPRSSAAIVRPHGHAQLYRYSSGTAALLASPAAAAAAEEPSSPSRYVTGVSEEDLRADPNIAAFFAANYPDHAEAKAKEEVLVEEAAVSPGEGPDDAATEAAAAEEEETTHPLAALNIRPLSCHVRNLRYEDGTRACEALRNRGLIPGILYGSDLTRNIVSVDASSKLCVKTPWNQIQRELDRYHHAFESRVYELTVYRSKNDDVGTTQLVIPQGMQRHPVQNKIYCVNYLRYHPGRPIHIPIRYINEEESPALKRGGFIVPVSRTVECIVEEGAPIPECIDLECTGLQLKQVLRMDSLIFPEGVRPSDKVKPDRFLVGTVYGRRSTDEDEEEEGTGEGEGGEEAKAE